MTTTTGFELTNYTWTRETPHVIQAVLSIPLEAGVEFVAAVDHDRQALLGELAAAKTEFFATGPGRTVKILRHRRDDAAKAVADAEAAAAKAHDRWQKSLADDGPDEKHEAAYHAARAAESKAKDRLAVLEQALTATRAGVADQLAAALEVRRKELVAAAADRLADAMAAIAATPWPVSEVILARSIERAAQAAQSSPEWQQLCRVDL